MNPWYYMYQPISYRFNSRAGTSEELLSLIKTCRSKGVRIYVDIVLNHFTGLLGGCKTKYCGKKSSAPFERQSPFYTEENVNDGKTWNEYPGATFGPEDIHVERTIDKWNDLTLLNNGWLSG
jgi:alpha-amylase